MTTPAQHYRQRHALITGGLGFLGSALAVTLSEAGASVTIVDAETDGDGANLQNIAGYESAINVVRTDIANEDALEPLIREADVIFNLAGKVSHIDSVNHPLADLHSNTVAHVHFLEVCRRLKTRAPIVYTSTRQIYGKTADGIAVEQTPIQPIDPNGISKFAADAYHRMYARDFGLPTVVLRLTNTYGPRQLLRHNRQGFIPWFIRLAMTDEEITIFGDGLQTRDVLYVDDVVDAVMRVGQLPKFTGQVFNVGSPFVYSVREIAATAIRVAGRGRLTLKPFPDEMKRIDIGSVRCDYSALTRATHWKPSVALEEGLTRTIAYYQQHLNSYL